MVAASSSPKANAFALKAFVRITWLMATAKCSMKMEKSLKKDNGNKATLLNYELCKNKQCMYLCRIIYEIKIIQN